MDKKKLALLAFCIFMGLQTGMSNPGIANEVAFIPSRITQFINYKPTIPEIVCHNCYKNTLADTLNHINGAWQAGANVIELDIIEHHKDIRISHGKANDFIGPALSAVLKKIYNKSNQLVLFIEVKSENISLEFSGRLVKIVKQFLEKRPQAVVYLRSFHDPVITRLHRIIKKTPATSNRVLLSKLYKLNWLNPVSEIYSNIKQISPMIAMVEFNIYIRQLPDLLAYAKNSNLKTNLWTLRNRFKHYMKSYPDKIDFMTIDSNHKKSQFDNIRSLKPPVYFK